MHKPRALIDCANPVIRAHPLNRGRVAWWLAVPGLHGGQVFHDLMALPGDFWRGDPGTLQNLGSPGIGQIGTAGWKGTTRPGGFAHVLFDQTISTNVNFGTGVQAVLNGTAWTISLWFRATTLRGTNQILFGFRGGSHARNIGLEWQSPGKITIGDETAAFIIDTTTVTAGKWYHVVWTYNNGANLVYLDGIQNVSASYTFSNSYTGSYYLGDPGLNSLTGAIDDVSVYSRPLGGAEIRALYTESITGYPATLKRIRLGAGSAQAGLFKLAGPGGLVRGMAGRSGGLVG